jgi:hypothetical protein
MAGTSTSQEQKGSSVDKGRFCRLRLELDIALQTPWMYHDPP